MRDGHARPYRTDTLRLGWSAPTRLLSARSPLAGYFGIYDVVRLDTVWLDKA